MIRAGALLLAGVLAAAAAPPLPLPPTPPPDPPTGDPAPVPDANLLHTSGGTPQSTEINVHVFSLHEHGGGLAYIPGSAYAAPEDRKLAQTPGFTVSVPMR